MSNKKQKPSLGLKSFGFPRKDSCSTTTNSLSSYSPSPVKPFSGTFSSALWNDSPKHDEVRSQILHLKAVNMQHRLLQSLNSDDLWDIDPDDMEIEVGNWQFEDLSPDRTRCLCGKKFGRMFTAFIHLHGIVHDNYTDIDTEHLRNIIEFKNQCCSWKQGRWIPLDKRMRSSPSEQPSLK